MGWSQVDLSEKTGFSPSHISEFLNYKRSIPLSFIRAYHEIADATPLEVLIQEYPLENEMCICGHAEAWHFEEETPCQFFTEKATSDCGCEGFNPLIPRP